MNEEITESGYVVISPKPGCTITQPVPGGQPDQKQEVMYFKIGTHSTWSGAQPVYARSNPNFWFQSFQVHFEGTPEGADDDLVGRDGPKQILQRMFASPEPGAGQQLYARVYPHENTEWWYTTDANAINQLRNLQRNWWNAWAPGAGMPALRHGTVTAEIGPDGSRGPDFTRRFGAVQWFREAVGVGSQVL